MSIAEAVENGILVDQQRLLGSRHWAKRLALFSQRAARSSLLGNARSSFRGRGMEFEEVRHYQTGDDIRSIDWKVTARSSDTYTKVFREERERPCHLVIDQRSTHFFGSTGQFKSVLAAEIATAIAWAVVSSGDRIGAQILGDDDEIDLRSRSGRKAVMGVVQALLDFNHRLFSFRAQTANAVDHTKTAFSHYLKETVRLVKPGTALYIISDFNDFDDAGKAAIVGLSKHNDITLVAVTDPMETTLPENTALAISNGNASVRVKFNQSMQKEYSALMMLKHNLLKETASQARAHLLPISTEKNARQTLLKVYRN